jgi:hypothetical protein
MQVYFSTNFESGKNYFRNPKFRFENPYNITILLEQ